MTDAEHFREADQMLQPTRAAWRYCCRKARRLFPLDAPLRIRRAPLARNEGGRWYGDKSGHLITINERLQLGPAVDVLLHEIAHAWLAEHDTNDGSDHGDAFWCVFGKFYRAWLQEPTDPPTPEVTK